MLVHCMDLKKIGKVLTSKSVWTGPSSYGKRIYRAAFSQRLRNTAVARYKKATAVSFHTISNSLLKYYANIVMFIFHYNQQIQINIVNNNLFVQSTILNVSSVTIRQFTANVLLSYIAYSIFSNL